jgi:hypothetical protein
MFFLGIELISSLIKFSADENNLAVLKRSEPKPLKGRSIPFE